MAKSKAKNSSTPRKGQVARVQAQAMSKSTQRSGPSVLTPPLVNMASSAGQQSEIALPVRKGLSTLTIHPDNTRWLGEAAPSFQRWGMAGLTLKYEPRVATSMNGQVALAFLSDFADLLPDSLEDTVTLSGSKRGAPWSMFTLQTPKNRLFDYCSLSDFEAGDATTMNDRSPGRIVCWADMDSGFSDTDIVGWVYISYKPVLQQPILRKMQNRGGGGGGGEESPIPNYPPPTIPGKSGYRVADYYYKERAYTTAYDFLGMNPNYNNEILALTPRIGYIYSDKLGYNAVVNTSAQTVRISFSVILRNFSWLSTPGSLKLRDWGWTLFPGNKGNYSAWDNGDVLWRMVGDLEPNGWFYLDNSIVTSWDQSEVYIFELGLENGTYVPPLKPPTFDWGTSSVDVFSVDDNPVATSTAAVATSRAVKLGASNRNQNYVGLQGYAPGPSKFMDGVNMYLNEGSAHTSFGGTNPNNRLGLTLMNVTGATKVFYINILASAYAANYSTTQLTPVVFGSGTVHLTTTSDAAHVCVVTLAANSVIGWSMALRSSSYNGGSAVESIGDVSISLQLASSYFPSY